MNFSLIDLFFWTDALSLKLMKEDKTPMECTWNISWSMLWMTPKLKMSCIKWQEVWTCWSINEIQVIKSSRNQKLFFFLGSSVFGFDKRKCLCWLRVTSRLMKHSTWCKGPIWLVLQTPIYMYCHLEPTHKDFITVHYLSSLTVWFGGWLYCTFQ